MILSFAAPRGLSGSCCRAVGGRGCQRLRPDQCATCLRPRRLLDERFQQTNKCISSRHEWPGEGVSVWMLRSAPRSAFRAKKPPPGPARRVKSGALRARRHRPARGGQASVSRTQALGKDEWPEGASRKPSLVNEMGPGVLRADKLWPLTTRRGRLGLLVHATRAPATSMASSQEQVGGQEESNT